MALADSLLSAIIRADGDALVMHVGERPYVMVGTNPLHISTHDLTLDTTISMMTQLLPAETLTTLEEFGAVEYRLPDLGDDRFNVVAARGGDDIWIEIRRRRQQSDAAVAAAAERRLAEEAAAEAQRAADEAEQKRIAAEAAAAEEQRRAVEAAAADEQRRAAEAAALEEQRRAAEAAALEEQRRAAEAAALEEQRRAAEAATLEEQRRAAEAAALEEQRRAAEAAALEEQRRAAEAAALEEQRRAAEAAALEEQRRAAEAAALEEQRRAAEAAALEEQRRAAEAAALEEQRRAAEAAALEEQRRAAEAAALEEQRRAAEAAALEEQRRAAEAAALEEQRRAAEAAALEEQRRAAEAAALEEQRRAAEAAALEEQRRAAEAAALEEQRRAAESAALEEQRRAAEAAALEEQRRAAEAAALEQQRRAAEAAALEEQRRIAAEAAAREEQRRAAEAAALEEQRRIAAEAKAAEERRRAALEDERRLAAAAEEAARAIAEFAAEPIPAETISASIEIIEGDLLPPFQEMAAKPIDPVERIEPVERLEPITILPMTRTVRIEVPPRGPSSRSTDIERLLRIGAARGASALFVTSESRPYIRVDGDIRQLEGEPVLSRTDVEAAIVEIAPETGREPIGKGEIAEWLREYPELGRIRCTTFNDHRGPGVILQMIATRAATAESLGLSREVQALATESQGLVLVAGARVSGKSTLLSALVDLVNRQRAEFVITLERQIRLVHDNRAALVSQREIRGGADEALAAARSALREGPDVLVIDDLISPHMVPLILTAASEGLLVFVSMAAASTSDAVQRFIELAPPEMRNAVQAAMAESFRGAVAQTLLKKTGGGLIAAREVLLATAPVTRVISEGQLAQLPHALESGRKHGMQSFAETLLDYVRAGSLDVREAFRKAPDRERLLAGLKREKIDTSLVERLA